MFYLQLRRLLPAALFLAIVIFITSCTQEPPSAPEAENSIRVTNITHLNKSTCIEGVQPSGALFKICIPDTWNRELVVFAHGYVAETEPLAIPEDQLTVDGSYVPDLVNDLGYAFATTSYRRNGLIVNDAIADIEELLTVFRDQVGRARSVYLIGASEGGLITTLAMEKKFFLFAGALSLCGPSGDFAEQINYLGDFRVLFDYFFPGIIPGSAVEIPQEVIDNFETTYLPAVQKAVEADPISTIALLRTAKAPVLPNKPETIAQTIGGLLWYNVFATNNAREVLGGNPFDNSERVYSGSFNDALLNASVQRFEADQKALDEISKNYTTTGRIFSPMIMLHTTGDEIVPANQTELYAEKAAQASPALLTTRLIPRYGHCNFKAQELVAAFSLLVYQVTGEWPEDIRQNFSTLRTR